MRRTILAAGAAFLAAGCTAPPPSNAGPGDRAPAVSLPGLDLRGRKAVVLVFGGVDCPRSRASEARVADLSRKHPEAAFFVVDSNWCDTPEEIEAHVKRGGFGVPWIRDAGGKAATAWRVEIQPTAFVLDANLVIRYRGLIDDHKNEELVRNRYLADALEAVLAGRTPGVQATDPAGCTVKKADEAPEDGVVTYAGHVAAILNRHCVGCHRAGQVAPFSLEGYEQARAWAPEIADFVSRRAMPPWKPVTNPDFYYNERRLSPEEISTLEAWDRAGAPRGDLRKAPAAPRFSDEWLLGPPDAVLQAEGGFELPAKGRDEYRCYVIRNPFPEDRWISAVEFKPGNAKAVHHILAFLDLGAQAEKLDAADPGPGYKSNGSGPLILPSGSLSGWAPGNVPRMLPGGTARLLRKGERVVLETHYHKTGRPELDEGARVALYFAKEPVKRKLHVHSMANVFLNIPAGAERHVASASWTVPKDVTAFDVMPHMHLIGREAAVDATFPDGTTRNLVSISDWDFNWQETYQFKEPVKLPRGTKVRLRMVYDNSAKNPNNPSHPPKPVRWGEQTTDEMCIAFIHFTNDREDLTRTAEEK
jgi:mono/diheme cytochrome c family protein